MKKRISLLLAILMMLNIVSVFMVASPVMTAVVNAATLYGDVDGDGYVNTTDVTLMMQHCANWNVAGFNTQAADVNNDGDVNTTDITLVVQAVAGWSIQLGPTPSPTNKTLKVLAIGNSFSVDAMSYLYDIAKDAGCTDINIGNLYIGGCSIATHLSNANDNTAAYTYYYANASTNGVMKSSGSKTMLYGIQQQDWDIITLQHVSSESHKVDKYNSDIDSLIAYVNSNKTNPNAKIYWHQTWAYQMGYNGCNQPSMYNDICSAITSKILTNQSFSGVIPVGTAIQNIRSSWLGDNFNRDGRHLNNIGKYVAGMTWVKYLTGLSIDNVTWTPGTDVIKDPALYLPIIKEAVNNAVATPLAMTQSTFTASPTPDPNATPTPTPSPTPVPAQAGTVYYQSFDTVVDKDGAITEGFTFSKASGNYTRGGSATDYYGSFIPAGNYIMVTFAPIALQSASYGPNTKIEASYEIARNRVSDGSWNFAGFVDAVEYAAKNSNNPNGAVVMAGHRPASVSDANSGVWLYRKSFGSNISTPSESELLVAGTYNATGNKWYTFKYVITLTDAQGQAITPTVDIYVDNMTTPVMTGKPILDSSATCVSGFTIASVAGSAKYYVDEILVRLIDDNIQ